MDFADQPADCCVRLNHELCGGDEASGLPSDWRHAFAYSSFKCLSPRAYLALRVFLCLWMNAVLIASVVLFSVPHPGYWCIYLTHWSLAVVCAHLTLAVFATLAARRSLAVSLDPPRRPRWLRLVWSIQAIALPASLLVFVLFWGLVYPCAFFCEIFANLT